MREINQTTEHCPLTMPRLRVLAKLCRNRGGTCDCPALCKALEAARDIESSLIQKQAKIERELSSVENTIKRLTSPMATLIDGYKFREGLTPVIVFEGDGGASFGYEDASGDWVEDNTWPFNEGHVWADDCERHGIRVE